MTHAQGGELTPVDWEEALESYWSRRSNPRDILMNWFERQGIAALRLSGPIDLLDVGSGDGELTYLVLHALAAGGAQIRSVTCVEPDANPLNPLDFNLFLMRADFPDTRFYIARVTLEELRPVGQVPPQFHLVMANNVYHYLSERERCFALLTDKFMRSEGHAIITAQMPTGIWAVVQELCQTPGWLYTDHGLLMHMGLLQDWACKSGLRSRLDVLRGDGIDVSPCFTDSREGQLILSVLVGHMLLGCAPETLSQAREALSHHFYSLPTEPTKRILPDPLGVLIVYGKDVEMGPAPANQKAEPTR